MRVVRQIIRWLAFGFLIMVLPVHYVIAQKKFESTLDFEQLVQRLEHLRGIAQPKIGRAHV